MSTPPLPPVSAPRNNEEKTWAMFTHLSALSGLIGVPFGHILGPLIIWLIKKDEMPLVNSNGKESLNFQISMTIYALAGITIGIITMFLVIGFLLLPLMMIAILITDLILVIIATVKTNNGESYRYPFTIPFIK